MEYFFRENTYACEDVQLCIGFYLRQNEYKKYFKSLTYNSYLDGLYDGEL